ncbi:MAG: aspartyl-tRNA(Asn)/glutamyl-tRNA(Gln) amidotransferase subunit B [Planctomycetota bacterium]|jgi:aspartyl-tRNA(Asn)/glutamyl-tRNA(Gln) amidotransferase subunit B
MTKKYYPTIGLEVHAELATETKMFCRSKNDPDAPSPNIHICPVCMAHPGTLPVPNKQAIEHVIKVGLALGSDIANFTEFDRKNFFYPDIPKGYQISQYKYPIVSGGKLAGFAITRVHLEEDTATSKHEGTKSLIDYNRAGVPLMELVTEPVIHSAEDAMRFGKELQLLMRYLGVSHANMEKGEMRVEVNISISTEEGVLGTRVEIKNLNSFSVVGKSIDYEIARMTAMHEAGRADEIVQETRGWDDQKQKTFSQRIKENSEEYRYFPDPDLPKMYLHDMFDLQTLRETLPELPWEMRVRYRDQYGIKDEDIEGYVTDKKLALLFENAVIMYADQPELIKLTSNYLTSDVVGFFKNTDLPSVDEILENIKPESLAKIITMIHGGDLNSRGAKDILLIMAKQGGNPEAIAEAEGLLQKSNPEELRKMAQGIIDENPEQAAQYRAGKEALLKFFVGQLMKASKGSANPAVAEEVFRELLG